MRSPIKPAMLLAVTAACFLVGAGGIYFSTRHLGVSSRPGLPAAGPAAHLDDASCARCHARQARGLAKTGHANTFRSAPESQIAAGMAGRVFQDVERGYSFHYHFDPATGLAVTIPERFGLERFPLTYELGSGHHAITFLTLVPDRQGDTVGIEHRVSLYPRESGWDLDLTPGHQGAATRQEIELLGKLIQGDQLTRCLSCHTNSAEIERQSLTNLRPNIGCQKCHGSGSQHVTAVEQGGKDPYAGFTRQSALAEVQLCGGCHRLPNPEAKVDPLDGQLARFQPVGLLQSRCFQRSSQRLKCSTCHDPHEPVSRDANHYVLKCLSCHGRQNTPSCPVSARTGCIECHMPPVDIHRGIEFHDHWIRVRRTGG
jgi:hypothetical protein